MNILSSASEETLDFDAETIIDIQEIFQEDGHSCVPVCIQMVLTHLSEKFDSVPALQLQEIGQCIGTTEGGTDNDSNLDNINDLLIRIIPSVEFVRDHSWPSWPSIVDDINSQSPVICWIESKDDNGKPFGHSVVVKGYENREVICNDPLKGEVRIPIEDFLLMWEEMWRFSIRVKVGERIERKMTDYAEDDKDV